MKLAVGTLVLLLVAAVLLAVVVAHRASTAARMDFVVWLDQGRVRAKAPHHQLWYDPEYRALFEPEERGQGPLTAVTESRGTQ